LATKSSKAPSKWKRGLDGSYSASLFSSLAALTETGEALVVGEELLENGDMVIADRAFEGW
jgi:hypothetical protein